jgi:hypothetical protein
LIGLNVKHSQLLAQVTKASLRPRGSCLKITQELALNQIFLALARRTNASADLNLTLDRLNWEALVQQQDQMAIPSQSVETQGDSAIGVLDAGDPEVFNRIVVVDKVFAQLTDEMDDFNDFGDF